LPLWLRKEPIQLEIEPPMLSLRFYR
jgi:hypothetical protein